MAILAFLVVTAGCAGVGEGVGDGTNETTEEQVTEPPVETTAEPTDAPPATDAPDDGGDGDTGGEESNNQTLLLLGALAVFAVGFVAAGILRGRNKSDTTTQTPPAAASTVDSRSDSERVISLLHENNGRMFEDVLQEALDWSPAHARRVLDGLVATGDIERRETDGGTLVVFTDPNRTPEEE
ncbi:hypothetical protein GJR96_14695 [Haloferax sp. MBLA0076]|uniref:DUF7343 domain-containing protein n=1 Tax=Haloferax litoreum TaxID=2666140 RepID=A0A6A8GK19_9EURY|nr:MULTISPECIES: hypothetical protein [Haloferax]KAB1194622.1 hypothetical protein Hfx1148_14625 [Haloferax sp. CBA1148]MRX23199.1 hypothetical protein [Haloferax litoreum]